MPDDKKALSITACNDSQAMIHKSPVFSKGCAINTAIDRIATRAARRDGRKSSP